MSIRLRSLAALAVLAGGVIIAIGECVYTSNQIQIPNFTPNGGLPHWRKCRAKVIANTGNCTVLVIGESTPRGWGAMFAGTEYDAASGAWPAQVALQLRQMCDGVTVQCINARANSVAGSGNVGAITAFTSYDTRVVSAGTWTINGAGSCYTFGNLVPGGCSFSSTDTTSPFQFNPRNTITYPSAPIVPTNTLDVYSTNVNLGGEHGVLLVNVNGGSTLAGIAQNAAGATTYTKTTVSTGSVAADSTWNLKCSVANVCLFDGIVARNSAVSEASFINMGMGGATVENWNISGAVYNPLSAIRNVYKPDLCVVQDQGNDQDAGTVIATYKTDYIAIITACQASGDVLIVTSQPGQAGAVCAGCTGGFIPTYDVQQTYVLAQQQVAASTGVPLLDWWTTMCGTVVGTGVNSTCSKGGWSVGLANGWNGSFNTVAQDPVHQGPYAYGPLASQVAAILRQ